MKFLLILLLASCTTTQEIQVTSTYVTVLEVTTKFRVNQDDELIFHLQAANGIRYMLERPMSDSVFFRVGHSYSFLAPR